jgi:large subunit ribosomal protein L9
MEILLVEGVPSLGQAGEVVRVRDGYARNYLLPRKLALPLTEGNRRRLESIRKKRERTELERRSSADALAAKLRELSVTVSAKTGEQGQLFAAVGPDAVAAALAAEGIEVPAEAIRPSAPLKHLGVHEVPVRLHPEVEVTLKVWVVEAD